MTAVALETPQPQEPAQPVNTVADNVAEWVDRNVKPPEAAPDEPPPPASWMDQEIPADFEHKFFVGKKNRDFFQSYKATESEMQRAQRELAQEKRAREQADADLAAHKLALEMAAEARRGGPSPVQSPGDSIDAQAEKLMWEQGPAAAFKFVREQHAADTQRIAEEAARRVTGQSEQKRTAEDITRNIVTAGRSAVDALIARGVAPEVVQKRFRAVIAEVTNPESRYVTNGNTGPQATQNYLDAWDDLFGDAVTTAPAAAPVAAPVTPKAPAKAPGSRTPAPPQAPNAGLPTMSAEKQNAYEMIAQRLGIDPAEYIKRIQMNTAARTSK